MRGLRPHELGRTLKKQPPQPLYFCLGEEDYLAAHALELLRAAAVGPEDFFNYQRFDAGGSPMVEIINAAATLPAFADRRMIVLTRAEALPADEQALLAAHLETLSPTTCLVVTAAKADQRRRLFSVLLQRAVVINCQPLLERELPAWLNSQATALGLQLSTEVVHALVEQTGTSLHALTNELEKLRAHTAGLESHTHAAPVKIELEALTQLVAHGREHSIFELTDAVGDRRLGAALLIARRLLNQGEQPVGLIAMLTRHLRRLWIARCALDAGQAPAALAQRLGVMPRYAETLSRQAAGFTSRQLQRALARCLVADAQLKGGRLPKEQVVEWLLVEVRQGLPGPLMVTPA